MDFVWLLRTPLVWLLENWKPILSGLVIGVFALYVYGIILTASVENARRERRVHEELDDFRRELDRVKRQLQDVEDKLE
jgi:uncharacterized membrane-anchored protein YhcB (DUF1043 family)